MLHVKMTLIVNKLDGTCGALVAAATCNGPHPTILGRKIGICVRLLRANDISRAGFILFHAFLVQALSWFHFAGKDYGPISSGSEFQQLRKVSNYIPQTNMEPQKRPHKDPVPLGNLCGPMLQFWARAFLQLYRTQGSMLDVVFRVS